jgi:hypothetical protein
MTNLSRRRFFGLLGGTAATYFLPPIGGWKSDVIASLYNVIPGECLFLLGASDGMLWWSKEWIDPLHPENKYNKKLDKQLVTV